MNTLGSGSLVPMQEAMVLGQHMIEAADVNQAVLEETIDSAAAGGILESGRTACGSADSVHDPRIRMPSAVELAPCPIGGIEGFWHTHVTRDQFLNPEHSLPDMANVLFEGVGASIVVGLETSQIFYAPEDPEAAAEVFRSVLGLEIGSADDVRDAIVNGHVPYPSEARERLFRELSPLVERRVTPLVDPRAIRADLHTIPTTMTAPGVGEVAYELYECAMAEVDSQVQFNATTGARITDRLRTTWDDGLDLGTYLTMVAFDEAIGVIIGTVVAGWIFDRRRR